MFSLEPTQDVMTYDDVDGEDGEEEEEYEDKVWGRLYVIGKHSFPPLDLEKDEYSFGRRQDCDYVFEDRKHPHFVSLSALHFRLWREFGHGGYTVFIEDKSSNGTFINGEKIGKGQSRPLCSDDEISLSTKNNKIFVFIDRASADRDYLPPEMKEKYVISRTLGRGACGEVKLAFEKGTRHKVAVKILSKKTFSIGPQAQTNLMEEVRIIKRLRHPGVICVENMYETSDQLFILLELMEGGELFDRVVKCGKFKEPVAKLYFYQMLSAVQYLHSQNVTHRDLKCENVLLSSDEEETVLKLTDFGLSRVVGEQSLMKTLCGTPNYLAPEVLTNAGLGGYSKAVDCWSLGVILYICLAGYPPFSDEIPDISLHDQIKTGHYSFPTKYWNSVSADAIDLIKRLLTVEPDKRITPSEALKHKWMKDPEVISRAERLMKTSSSCDSSDGSPPSNEQTPGNPSASKRIHTPDESPRLAKRSQSFPNTEPASV